MRELFDPGAFFFDLHKYCWIKNIVFLLPQKCESYVAREQAKLTRENACAVLFDENCCKVEGFFFKDGSGDNSDGFKNFKVLKIKVKKSIYLSGQCGQLCCEKEWAGKTLWTQVFQLFFLIIIF